jgi:hypothetical protein
MTGIGSPSLFVALENKPQLYVVSNPGAERIRLSAFEYHLVDSEIGFYDFLRTREMEVIGLRFSPFECQAVLDYAFPLSYTYVERKRSYMEIYFRGHRGLSVPWTAEQAFGDDAVWRNETGIYVVQVGTDHLTQAELDSLKVLTVEL